MTSSPLRDRIVDQFSSPEARGDVWGGFALFLDTDAYLNLGYSPWYLPHVVGSPQRRLAGQVGADLVARRRKLDGIRLLDVGCGRGGPAVHLAMRFGFDVTGVDLVPVNVATATENAVNREASCRFLVGDATRLPLPADSFDAGVAIDSLVYVPDRRAAFGELARVVRPAGLVVVSDLVVADGLARDERAAVDAFADAWDLAQLASVDRYRSGMERARLTVDEVRDVTANSVGRFRRWTRPYLQLADRAPGVLARTLDRLGLDAEAVTGQVRAAHNALPHLQHVVVRARVDGGEGAADRESRL